MGWRLADQLPWWVNDDAPRVGTVRKAGMAGMDRVGFVS